MLLGLLSQDDLQIGSAIAQGSLDHQDDGPLKRSVVHEHNALGHRTKVSRVPSRRCPFSSIAVVLSHS